MGTWQKSRWDHYPFHVALHAEVVHQRGDRQRPCDDDPVCQINPKRISTFWIVRTTYKTGAAGHRWYGSVPAMTIRFPTKPSMPMCVSVYMPSRKKSSMDIHVMTRPLLTACDATSQLNTTENDPKKASMIVYT